LAQDFCSIASPFFPFGSVARGGGQHTALFAPGAHISEMVVLSVAIVTSNKTLVSRQFVEMTRLRVEGLLTAFPKLLDSGKDHTYIETETVRYVYQPMESLYLVLVTNKSSNILEDLETLRLLAKVVQDCCHIQVNEELVLKHAFDIVFAFDEVISFGHRESVTLSQIKTYCEMDSHEEKLHQMIEQSKINEAKELAKKKEKDISKIIKAEKREEKNNASTPSGLGPSPSFQETISSSPSQDLGPSMPSWQSQMDDSGPAPLKPHAPKKGMALGKKKPGDIFAGLGISEPAPVASEPAAVAAAEEEAPAPVVNPLLEPVKVDIEETISASLEVEGGLSGEAVCVGEFKVTVIDTAKADLVCFKMQSHDPEFKYKVHPNLNKASWDQNVLEVRDKKAFRANQVAPLVKWRSTSTKEDFLPVSLGCWPQATPDGTQIVLELELTDTSVTLEDVRICFPAAPQFRPTIQSAEPGEAVFDAGSGQVVWHIPVLDSNEGNGTLEFSASTDQASLLPYTFTASRRGQTKCPMDILECYHQERSDKIDYAIEKASTYSLTVGA